jgi:nitrate/nitrite response regulator protein
MFLILDDHPIARKGLESILHMYRPDDKVLQAGTVKEAIDNMQNNNIDMAFIDLNLNEENGLDFLKWLKKERQEVKTIFITSSSREQDFLQAKDMGVDAYILKDAFIDEIMFGLKAVERGSKFYSAELVENIGSSTEEDKKLSSLTARETEVLKLLHCGYSNLEISEKLFISNGTTKKHVSSILSKLGLKNRVEAVLFADKSEDFNLE